MTHDSCIPRRHRGRRPTSTTGPDPYGDDKDPTELPELRWADQFEDECLDPRRGQ